MPRARRLLGVPWAARLAISRRAPLPRRRWGAASSAVATPRVAPGPAHAGSQVAPAYVDAFRAASAGMASRLCLGTDRLRAFGRSSPAAPRRPRSTVSAAPAPPPEPCVHLSHPSHPTQRSRTRSPLSAAHTHLLHASRPPHPVSPGCAQELKSCPWTSTRVEEGAPRRRGGGSTADAGWEGAQAPGGGPGGHAVGRCGASKAVGTAPAKQPKSMVTVGIFSEAICDKILVGSNV